MADSTTARDKAQVASVDLAPADGNYDEAHQIPDERNPSEVERKFPKPPEGQLGPIRATAELRPAIG